MKRRTYLASATLVALAGCSETSAPSDPDNETNVSAQGNETDGNETETNAQDGPTDEEIAAGHLADAQTALQTAVTDLDAQAGLEATFASGFNAADELNATPVTDALTSVRSATANARDVDLTRSQQQTADGLEAGEAFVRAIVDIHPDLRQLHTDVGYLLADAKADDWERVNSDMVDVQRAYSSLDTGPVVGAFMGAEGSMGSVDALSDSDVTAQNERVAGESAAVGAILDAIETLQSAEEAYAGGVYSDAKDIYMRITPLPSGYGFSGGTGWLSCYASHMHQSSKYLQIAANRKVHGGDWRSVEKEGENERSKANNCELSGF